MNLLRDEKKIILEDKGFESVTFGMNTVITHKAYGKQAKAALRAAERETLRLERMLSRFIPESDISRINSSAGKAYESVNSETYSLLLRAKDISRRCGGYFDITVSPLVDLWRSAGASLTLPGEAEIKQAIALVDHNDIMLDPLKASAFLKREGQSIDLGGIGKGYAADIVLNVFKNNGISSAFTNFGGNVAAIGMKPDESFWRVGIRHPRKEGSLIGVISAVDKSVVTSGDYQRYFISGGRRYHHILDPHTGYPSESGLISVTVVADSSMDADALSTMLFVAGKRKGLEILKTFPGTEAVLVDTDIAVTITQGLKSYFQATEGIKINFI